MRVKLSLIALLLITPLISVATDYYRAISDLNVRAGAGTSYSISFTLKKGDLVELVSKENSWYRIKYLGKTGYAHSKYLILTSNTYQTENKEYQLLSILIAIVITTWLVKRLIFEIKRKQRRDFYRNEYLQSDEWQRKRAVVLSRDNWHCVYCGSRATQVHHKKYSKRSIGKEPIQWLVSVCKDCHEAQHRSIFAKLLTRK